MTPVNHYRPSRCLETGLNDHGNSGAGILSAKEWYYHIRTELKKNLKKVEKAIEEYSKFKTLFYSQADDPTVVSMTSASESRKNVSVNSMGRLNKGKS